MIGANVWRRMLGVDRVTVIEEIDFDEEADWVVVHVRPIDYQLAKRQVLV